MRQIEQLLGAWPLLAMALLLACALVLTVAFMLHAGTRLKLEWMGVYFIGVPLSMALGVLIQGRELGQLGLVERPDLADFIASNWASRVITLICLAVALERVIRFFLRGEYRHAHGTSLVIALLVYVVGVSLLPGLFGSQPGLTHHMAYAPLVALGVYAYAQANGDQCIRVVRNATLLFLLASFAVLLVKPSAVAETNYSEGLIAGFRVRFYGLATHANTLAPLCLALMTALWLRRFRWVWLNVAAWITATAALLLTQSKTSILLVAVVMGGLALYRRAVDARRQGASAVARNALIAVAVPTIATAALVGVVFAAMLADPRLMDRFVAASTDQQVLSLTGRTAIWTETLRVMAENPLFGYGPGIWGPEFRIKAGMFFTHAHNQYLQTAGAGGVFGLLALAVLLLTLLTVAWRARRATQGVSVGLAVYIVVRGFTEVPLPMGSAMTGEFLVLMFLFVLCIRGGKQDASGQGGLVRAQARTAPGT